MLTRAQIQRLAQRHGIGLQAQERDYVQHLLLFLLYRQGQDFIFKGGTALRVAYRSNRYSEDLDFNGPADANTVQARWQAVLEGLLDFGIPAEMREDWQSEVGYSFDVSYQGPLFDGRDRTKGKVRVDINRRPEPVETRRLLVAPEYDDLRPFVVTVLTPEHLLAEKVRALLARGKPRDLYDCWLLLSQGVFAEADLIRRKLALYGLSPAPELFDKALQSAVADWERDLCPLLPQLVPWQEAAHVLEDFLHRILLT